MSERSATRYAILGHLALRDWGAYELTRSLRRTLHWFWPRAESLIYAEIKRLEAAGLAASHEEPAADGSSRTRTVYRITVQGRRALARWLKTPSEGFSLYAEPLLRLHLAGFGDKQELVDALTTLREAARDLLADGTAVATEFDEGRHLLQQEAHIRGLLFDALWSIGLTMEGFAERALDEIGRWDGLEGDAAARERGVETMRQALRKRADKQKG